jgi:hypothetical protein
MIMKIKTMKLLTVIALLLVMNIKAGAQSTNQSNEKHEPHGELILDIGIVYKVKTVKWLDKNNGLKDKADINISLTINETKDTLTTNIPILNGRFHTKFMILQSATYDFTGIPALIYGTTAIDMDLLDIENMKRIRILISDQLIIVQ